MSHYYQGPWMSLVFHHNDQVGYHLAKVKFLEPPEPGGCDSILESWARYVVSNEGVDPFIPKDIGLHNEITVKGFLWSDPADGGFFVESVETWDI